MQAAHAERDGRHEDGKRPEAADQIVDGGDGVGIDDHSQQTEEAADKEDDDAVGEEPPPEFAAGRASLEHRVLLEEADDRLAHLAAVGRHVKRCGQIEEAAAGLRCRCRLSVIGGRVLRILSVLRSLSVLRLSILGILSVLRLSVCRSVVLWHLAVIGGSVLRCLLAVVRLVVLRRRLWRLWIVLVGVRH